MALNDIYVKMISTKRETGMTTNGIYNTSDYANGFNSGYTFNLCHRKSRRTAGLAAKKAVRILRKSLNGIYMSVAGIALGLSVFFILGTYASPDRGPGGGIGGEFIAAAGTVLAFNFMWRRIKSRLKDD